MSEVPLISDTDITDIRYQGVFFKYPLQIPIHIRYRGVCDVYHRIHMYTY